MKKLICYVGLDNKYVLCERFPDDEEHAGLHDMLQDFLDYDDVLVEEPLEQGFYSLEFVICNTTNNFDGEHEAWLELKSYEKRRLDNF